MRKCKFDIIDSNQEVLLKSKPRSPTTQYVYTTLPFKNKIIQEHLAKISTTSKIQDQKNDHKLYLKS